MKYFESAYDLPCYNYAKIVAGDIRYLIEGKASEYPKKLKEEENKRLIEAFEEITKELPKGKNDKENTYEEILRIDILEYEFKVKIYETLENIFQQMELVNDLDFSKNIRKHILNFGVKDVKSSKSTKIHFINKLNEAKTELDGLLLKQKKENTKSDKLNESDFFNSISLVSNHIGIDLNPKKTSIADFITRYNLLIEEQKKKEQEKNIQNGRVRF